MSKSTNSGRKSTTSRAQRVVDPSRRGIESSNRATLGRKTRVSSDSTSGRTAESSVDAPTDELAPIGPHRSIHGRNANGTFAAGNDAHLETGVFSEKRWRLLQPELLTARAEILQDKGFTDADADHVMVRVIDGFNQAVVMMNSYFDFLARSGGPISAKGRQRRAVEGWSRAADRVAKFAAMLGLEKRARAVKQTPIEWLESLNEASEDTHAHAPDDHRATRSDTADNATTTHDTARHCDRAKDESLSSSNASTNRSEEGEHQS